MMDYSDEARDRIFEEWLENHQPEWVKSGLRPSLPRVHAKESPSTRPVSTHHHLTAKSWRLGAKAMFDSMWPGSVEERDL